MYFPFDVSRGFADQKNDLRVTQIKVFETGKSPNGTNNYTQMIENDCEAALFAISTQKIKRAIWNNVKRVNLRPVRRWYQSFVDKHKAWVYGKPVGDVLDI